MERALFVCLPPLAEPLSPNIWKALIFKMSVLEEREKLRNVGKELRQRKTQRRKDTQRKREGTREGNKEMELKRQNIKAAGNTLQTFSGVINMLISHI